MWGRRIIFLAAIAAAVWYLKQHSGNGTTTTSMPKIPGTDKPKASYGCVAAAERANGILRDAASLVGRPPVDQNAWSNEEGKVSNAIETAESECGGASSDTDRNAMDESRAALAIMRSSLADLSSAARGSGGAGDIARKQGEIDDHLNKAKGR